MKFTEILEELRKGKKVTREKWEKPGDSCAIDFIMYDQKRTNVSFIEMANIMMSLCGFIKI